MSEAFMTPPRVTVVVPTIGRPELSRCIESVLGQTVDDIELVVVVDRSSKFDEIEKQLAGTAAKVMLAIGSGGSAARNTGVQAASGRFVAFLDDDDTWEPRKLEHQLDALARSVRPQMTIICGLSNFVDAKGRTRVGNAPEPLHELENVANYLVERRRLKFGSTYLQTCSLFASRELLLSVPWDEELLKHQDWDLFTRLLTKDGITLRQLDYRDLNVFQGSGSSVSKRPHWRSSSLWLAKHSASVTGRARADFVFVHIIWAALYTRDWRGLRAGLAELPSSPPHFAAIVRGVFGIIQK